MNALNVSKINEWIEKELKLPFTIYNDIIPDNNDNAACVRFDPSPAAEQRYIDGTRLIAWNLTYYIRSNNRTNARNWAFAITDKLDGHSMTVDGYEIQTSAMTLPQFISVDDKNNTIYSAAITATLLDKE